MITLENDTLNFHAAETDPGAVMTVEFERTLRIPDDENTHSLPPSFGQFPLRHVDDYAQAVGPETSKRGGVILPMHASEALWLSFGGSEYPFALKIAAGKINAVTGEQWREGLHADPQDYLVVPDQPWLDGFAIEKGVIRQFVAERLGEGYSVEEQLTGRADFGGIQIVAYPMKPEAYRKLILEPRRAELMEGLNALAIRIERMMEGIMRRLAVAHVLEATSGRVREIFGGLVSGELYELNDQIREFERLFSADNRDIEAAVVRIQRALQDLVEGDLRVLVARLPDLRTKLERLLSEGQIVKEEIDRARRVHGEVDSLPTVRQLEELETIVRTLRNKTSGLEERFESALRPDRDDGPISHMSYSMSPMPVGQARVYESAMPMGLAAGGRMKQEIYRDHYGLEAWDQSDSSRCFITLMPADAWLATTGEAPPPPPPGAKAYTEAGMPWFDYKDSKQTPVPGSAILASVKSWITLKGEKGKVAFNQPTTPQVVVKLGPAPRKRKSNVVREG